MTFMNPWLLLGGLAVALPVIAHMLNNFRFKETNWGAMQFLNRSVRVRSSELRLRDVLLMLLRCLAILLLILAFSKPEVSKNGSLSFIPGEYRAGVIIALDVSYSMQHSDGARTRLEQAIEKIEAITSQMQTGDPISLLLLADEHRIVVHNMIYEPKAFSQLLREQKIRPEGLNVDTIAKRLNELCEGTDTEQVEVYIVTDLQEKDWDNSSVWRRNAFKELSEQATVFMVPVDGEQENVAVTNFELVSGVLRKNTTARYRATIHNYNKTVATNVKIRCMVNNIAVDSKVIKSIQGNSSATVSLFVPFNNSGALRISAVVDKDGLELDNKRHIVAMVREKVSVLSVEGSSDNASASTSFLSKALHANESDNAKKDLTIRSISWVAFPTVNIDDYDVVILSDVPTITDALSTKLSTYVKAGNGLIWFAGKNVKLPIWNKQSAKSQPPLLPAILESVSEIVDEEGVGIALDTVLPDHAVCRSLKSLPEDLLSEAQFKKVINVTSNPGSNVILKLSGSETPILIEQTLGRGYVFMFTSSADTSWNNMALTPTFPMLVQQSISYMTGREFEKPRTVGDSLSLIYKEKPDVNDAVFNTPSGKVLKMPVREHRNQFVAMLDQSTETGFYTAQASIQAPPTPIAVNVDTSESDLNFLSSEGLNTAFEGTGFIVTNSNAELLSAIDDSRSGLYLSRYLFIAGFILLIIESLLAYRKRQKRSNNQVEAI